MAAHTGQIVEFDDILNCEHEFAPGLADLKLGRMLDTIDEWAAANGESANGRSSSRELNRSTAKS